MLDSRPLHQHWHGRLVRIAALLLILPAATKVSAQGSPAPSAERNPWSLAATVGGSYALSDLEIVPGIDQNGGWTFDAGLRAQRGRVGLGIGFERLRFATNYEGSAIASGVYIEPRFFLTAATRPLSPYVFAHAERIFDYSVDVCCSVYPVSSDAYGWLAGAGFGVVTAPVGPVRFDISAGLHHLAGKSTGDRQIGSWRGDGPMVDIRIGASIPLRSGSLGNK